MLKCEATGLPSDFLLIAERSKQHNISTLPAATPTSEKSIPYCQVLYVSIVFARLTVTTTNTVMNSDYIYNEEPFTNKMKYPNRSYKLLAMQLSLKQAPKPTLNSCLPFIISYNPALPSLQFKMSQRNTTIFSISLRD